MVAKINNGKSIIGALNYNENKVQKDKAQLIDASGYFKDLEDLNFYDKLFRLTDLAARNERTKIKAVHISLNFPIHENLETALLNRIIAEYMELIGFIDQPYLAYKHLDAGHPHVHIVTTNIKPSGERINLNLLGKTKSSDARRYLEDKYGLIKTGVNTELNYKFERSKLEVVNYGKMETKRAITNVINEVLKTYKFTSLPEFNAVLNQFNITADRGSKDSKMYEKKGLVYWIQDFKGNRLGIPIKASSVYGKPTMKTLEGRFRLNEILRKPQREQLKNLLNAALNKGTSKDEFQKRLSGKGVHSLFRHNEDGRLYGATFVDNISKVVFNGSDLGKEFSANALAKKFADANSFADEKLKSNLWTTATDDVAAKNCTKEFPTNLKESMIDSLFKEETQDMAAIGKLQRKRKKKRKGNSL